MHITISDYTKRIKGVNVLQNINLELESGNIYGLKGVNGSGKTMLMRAICGLILPTQGKVEIDGKELGKEISFPPSVGLLLENPAFVNGYTGFKNLKMIAALKGIATDEDIRKALNKCGLDPDDKRTFRKYSLGMKQKLGIACAVMENPELIILDEPTNALDEKGVNMVRDMLMEYKNSGAMIIISCHDKEQLEYLSDNIIEIYEGKIVE
ncbi:MAG: ATP-binding cassette domain-containing protein [Lachnospira sp.]